jgi:hypothetical protein
MRLPTAIAPRSTIGSPLRTKSGMHRDYVVCLDCGYRGKTLTRHIAMRHGLSGDEYRQRWGLRSNHPLTAPAYSEHRSTMAKALGFGRKSTTEVDPAPTPAAAANPKARRTPRSRPASKSEGVATKMASRPTPARKRHSRDRSRRHPVSGRA